MSEYDLWNVLFEPKSACDWPMINKINVAPTTLIKALLIWKNIFCFLQWIYLLTKSGQSRLETTKNPAILNRIPNTDILDDPGAKKGNQN